MCTPTKNAFWASAKVLRCLIIVCFFFNLILPAQGFAQAMQGIGSGPMLQVPMFSPAMMIGMEIFPDNPFQFDFIVHGGDEKLEGDALKAESERMIKYFLASLTIPDQDLWVNLSPYEQDRILPDALAQTDLGRDLLAQDYVLKQFTSALINPDSDLGKRFWDRVYQKAFEMYQTTQIPVDTFNKVWIMPGKASVYRHGNMTFVSQASLKVMLEEDYVALQANQQGDRREHVVSSEKPLLNTNDQILTTKNTLASDIIREIILPELEQEVNTSKSFAALRQAYHALILGTWFKINLKESLLGKTYMNRSTVSGIDLEDKTVKQKIYESYVSAYKQGAYHFVRAEYDVHEQKHIARQYFSGGVVVGKELSNKISEDRRPSGELEEQISSGINTRVKTALSTADPSLPATSSAIKIPVLPSTLAPKAVVEKLVGILEKESREVLVEIAGKPLTGTQEIYLQALEAEDLPFVSGFQITFDDGAVMKLSKKYINPRQGSVWFVDSWVDAQGEAVSFDQDIKIPSGIFVNAPKMVDSLHGLNFRQASRYLTEKYKIYAEDIRVSLDRKMIIGQSDGRSYFLLTAQDQDWLLSSGTKGITPLTIGEETNNRIQRQGPVSFEELDASLLALFDHEAEDNAFDVAGVEIGNNVHLESDYAGKINLREIGLYADRKGQSKLSNMFIYADEYGRVHKQSLEEDQSYNPQELRTFVLTENALRIRIVKGLAGLLNSSVKARFGSEMMVKNYEGADATVILSKVFGKEKTLKELYADSLRFWGDFNFAVRLAEDMISLEQSKKRSLTLEQSKKRSLTNNELGQMIFDMEKEFSLHVDEQRQRALSAETQPIDDYFFKFWNIPLPKRETFPSYRDLGPGQLFFDPYDKLYPLARNFFLMYGGEKKEYQFLRPLAEAMADIDFFVGQTKDVFGDVDTVNNQITINAQFFDFLAHTGYKKISLSFLASLVAQLKPRIFSSEMTMKEMEILVGSSKKSLVIKDGSRLDDVKALYQLKQKIIDNDINLKSAQNPYYLSKDDYFLFISDMLHRGKNLSAQGLVERLTDEYGIYGQITNEQAQIFLSEFQSKHADIVVVSEVMIEDPVEDLKEKLDPNTSLIIAEQDIVKNADEQRLIYGLNKDYVKDPALSERITVWDIEVERQDEIAFGGKTAHTGEMGYIPGIVTLPNFASAGETFQRLFSDGSREEYLDHLEKIIKNLVAYRDQNREQLLKGNFSTEDQKKILNELALMRVIVDPEEDETFLDQINKALRTMNDISDDMRQGKDANLRDYFLRQGHQLDREVQALNAEKESITQSLRALEMERKTKAVDQQDEITKEIRLMEERLQVAQLTYEKITAETTRKLLIAGRTMIVSEEIRDEFRRNLKILADRMSIPLEKLVLAIRSSAVGEDSETASFAGRQDTQIFVTPFATAEDQEGLDCIVINWIFNQASLFNKRAVDYRFDYGLPTFDEHVEISTLFQEMFLSQLSYVGFSVNRETGFPVMTLSATEGQGEMLVSGQEGGSEFILTYDGQLVSRKKGTRSEMIIETPDGLGKVRVEIPEDLKREFAVTDKKLLSQVARYFKFLHDYYGDYVDLEGALRVKRDDEGRPVMLKDEQGNILVDERGFPRYDWMIVSTQARPETVWSQRDPHKIFMKQVSVSEQSFKQAQDLGKVLPFNFLAKTGGVSQGSIFWVLDKNPETLAQTIGKIMATYQSDPDMNSAMIAAKGILAIKGGPNSHTMIVASEYGLVAVTGMDVDLTAVQNMIPNGTKVTIDANRGKILLGTDYVLHMEGRDFRPVDLPRTQGRMGVFAATTAAAFKVAPLREMIDSYGIGLHRLELTLTDKIGIYPDLLLAYDNLIKKEQGLDYEGPILDRDKDQDKIAYVAQAIEGFNSAEDFYISSLSEDISAISVTTVAPLKRVVMHAQTIKDPRVRVDVLKVVKDHYQQGLGEIAPVKRLEQLRDEMMRGHSDSVVEGSDIEILSDVIKLIDKRHYIRLDDRKSDEYEAVFGAYDYIQREINPMKGFRGLDLMFNNVQTFRWQLRAIKRAIDMNSAKFGIFAPVVRRPSDVVKFLEILDEEGLIHPNVKVGIMTELPTNSINIEDFLMAVATYERQSGKKVGDVDFFTSTGGNDGLQTLYRIDRNASNESLQKPATDESLGIFRWNARITKVTGKINGVLRPVFSKIKNAVCGNAASKFRYYAGALFRMGYDAVSSTPESFQNSVEYAQATGSVSIPRAAEQSLGFDFDINPADLKSVKIFEDHQVNIGRDFHLKLGFHYRTLKFYDDVLLPKIKKGESLSSEEQQMYDAVRKALSDAGIVAAAADQEGSGMNFYRISITEWLREELLRSQDSQQRLFIAMDAVFSNEYRNLTFGDKFEPVEANPEFGVHGAVKVLQAHLDRDFFKEQLNAIKHVLEEADINKNIVFQMRSVRSRQEIDQILGLMEDVELNISIALDIEVGANVMEIDEILKSDRKISEMTVTNPVQFTSDLMVLETVNVNGNNITSKDQAYQLTRPVMILATAARKAGIPFSVDSSLSSRLQELIVQTQGLPPQNKDTGLIFYIDALTGNIVPVDSNERNAVSLTGEDGVNVSSPASVTSQPSVSSSPTGGIDFATLYKDLEIEIDENGVPLPVEFQDLERIRIDRLTPMIMHMVPVPHLYFQLGLDQQDPDLADIARAGN